MSSVLRHDAITHLLRAPHSIGAVDPMWVYLSTLHNTEQNHDAHSATAATYLWNSPNNYYHHTGDPDLVFFTTRSALTDALALAHDAHRSGYTTAITGEAQLTPHGQQHLYTLSTPHGDWNDAPLHPMSVVYFTSDETVNTKDLTAALSPLLVEQSTPTNTRIYGPAEGTYTLDAVTTTLAHLRISHHGIRRRPTDVSRRHLPALDPDFWNTQAQQANEALNRVLHHAPYAARATAFNAVHASGHGPLTDYLGMYITTMGRVYDNHREASFPDYNIARLTNWITDLDDSLRGSGIRSKLTEYTNAKNSIEHDLSITIHLHDQRIKNLLGWNEKTWNEFIDYLTSNPSTDQSLTPLAGVLHTNTTLGSEDSAPADPASTLPAQAEISRALVTAALRTGFNPGDPPEQADALPFLTTYLEHWCAIPKSRIHAAAGLPSSTMRYRTKKTYDTLRRSLYHLYLNE